MDSVPVPRHNGRAAALPLGVILSEAPSAERRISFGLFQEGYRVVTIIHRGDLHYVNPIPQSECCIVSYSIAILR